MGALHEGHLALIEASKGENEVTIASIFVNPTQFNDPSDLEKYPRTQEEDCALLEKHGCDAVFIPDNQEVYPSGMTKIEVDYGQLTNSLEGAHRKGHFDGVVQVVRRLFNLVPADRAYFGEKDFQQLSIIRHMVKTDQIDMEIKAVETIRESSGLALSSRNRQLDEKMIHAALALSKALAKCEKLDARLDLAELKEECRLLIVQSGARLEYFEFINELTFDVVDNLVEGQKIRAVAAAYVGEVRLIDNIAVEVVPTLEIKQAQPH